MQSKMYSEMNDKWFKLLTLLDQTDHLTKGGDWYMEDKMEFYDMKDNFLFYIINEMPEELEVQVNYIPYYKYSKETKDKAGELMREDDQWRPFKYYLSLVEPSEDDVELIDKGTIEIEITCQGRLFSFHVPQDKTEEWNLDIDALPRKEWISGKEFHREQYNNIKDELSQLIDEVKGDHAESMGADASDDWTHESDVSDEWDDENEEW